MWILIISFPQRNINGFPSSRWKDHFHVVFSLFWHLLLVLTKIPCTLWSIIPKQRRNCEPSVDKKKEKLIFAKQKFFICIFFYSLRYYWCSCSWSKRLMLEKINDDKVFVWSSFLVYNNKSILQVPGCTNGNKTCLLSCNFSEDLGPGRNLVGIYPAHIFTLQDKLWFLPSTFCLIREISDKQL